MTGKVWKTIVVCACLSGCASFETAPPAPPPAAPPTPAPEPAPTDTVSIILEQARTLRRSGRLADAETTLEAALRIEPADARLWLELAEIQFAAGEFDAAGNLAERAVSLAAGDAAIIEAAGRIRAQIAN